LLEANRAALSFRSGLPKAEARFSSPNVMWATATTTSPRQTISDNGYESNHPWFARRFTWICNAQWQKIPSVLVLLCVWD